MQVEEYFKREFGKDPIIFPKGFSRPDTDTSDYEIIGEKSENVGYTIFDSKNKIIYQFTDFYQSENKLNEVFVESISEIIKEYNEIKGNNNDEIKKNKIIFVYRILFVWCSELNQNSIDKLFEEFLNMIDREILSDAVFTVINTLESFHRLNNNLKIVGSYSTNFVGILTMEYNPKKEYIYNHLKNIFGFEYEYIETIKYKNIDY